MQIYLDIETDWSRSLTVLGLKLSDGSLVQLVGREITKSRLLRSLPKEGRLVTYNGHCFDLPVIRTELGINLRDHYESLDLRWVCQRAGIMGGQKGVEQSLGVKRTTEGVDGLEAIALWERHVRGDKSALEILLRYNAEDLDGMIAIENHLKKRRLLT